MEKLENKEIVQAVLIADNFNDNFQPLTDSISTALLPLVNVPLLDYALESLNRCGVEEVFVFCCNFIDQVRSHINDGIANKCTWSLEMVVRVVGSEGCRCLGDALRDLDAKALLRGHFILMGADTVSTAQLLSILEKHKRNAKLDKGNAMTVVYKRTTPDIRTGDEIIIAKDRDTNRLLFHQRTNPLHKERQISFPLEIFLINSNVILQHDLVDPQIAICSPSVLPLFADNFDFETRDDFIRGLLINEEILASTIYVAELPPEQYAAKVSNWQTYKLISNEIINRWAYPLVPDMGICCLKQIYMFLRKNIYRNKNVQLARDSLLKENIVINEKCSVGNKSVLSYAVIGKNCKIGKNCHLDHCYLMDDVLIEDDCKLSYCVIGKGVKILKNSSITEGAVFGHSVVVPTGSKIEKHLIQATLPDDDEGSIKLGDHAFTIPENDQYTAHESDDDDDVPLPTTLSRMVPLKYHYTSSIYSSSSGDDESQRGSPIPEDANIFLSEVIDSLKRGYNEKSNPDFLILEINSSRYAYNMTLTEVNFYVVKAIFSLPPILEEGANILTALEKILKHLGPVLKNYIRGDDAMMDCLKAVEECCNQNAALKSKAAQIIHYLYDKEIVTEDAILAWHEQLDGESVWLKNALSKLIAWLMESSEEETSDEDDD